MDASTDDRTSRAPEVEDLVALCRHLNAAGARYAIIGGFAVILHGSVRGTKDIDLLVDAAPENIRRVKQAMAHLPDNAVAQITDDEVGQYQVVRIADEIVVDLMAKACGIDYATLAPQGIEHLTIDDVVIPFASKEWLIRMKDTVRPSDRSDVQFLERLIAETTHAKT